MKPFSNFGSSTHYLGKLPKLEKDFMHCKTWVDECLDDRIQHPSEKSEIKSWHENWIYFLSLICCRTHLARVWYST